MPPYPSRGSVCADHPACSPCPDGGSPKRSRSPRRSGGSRPIFPVSRNRTGEDIRHETPEHRTEQQASHHPPANGTLDRRCSSPSRRWSQTDGSGRTRSGRSRRRWRAHADRSARHADRRLEAEARGFLDGLDDGPRRGNDVRLQRASTQGPTEAIQQPLNTTARPASPPWTVR